MYELSNIDYTEGNIILSATVHCTKCGFTGTIYDIPLPLSKDTKFCCDCLQAINKENKNDTN
jgi:hypothetical protein